MSDQGSTYDNSYVSSSHESDDHPYLSKPVIDIAAELLDDCEACEFNSATIASNISKLEKDLVKLQTTRQQLEDRPTATETTAVDTTAAKPPTARTGKAAKNAKKAARRKLVKKLKKAGAGTVEARAPDPEMARELSEKIADIEAQIAAYRRRGELLVLKCRVRTYHWYIHCISHENLHLDGDELASENATPDDFPTYGKSLRLLRDKAMVCEVEIAMLEKEDAAKERDLSDTTTLEQDTSGAEGSQVTDAMPEHETGGSKEAGSVASAPEQEDGDVVYFETMLRNEGYAPEERCDCGQRNDTALKVVIFVLLALCLSRYLSN